MSLWPDRLIAVDWSGSKDEARQRKTVWIADWCESTGTLTLHSGRLCRQTIDFVLEAAERSAGLIAGFDFGFSFPRDFADGLGCETVEDLWEHVRRMGPTWLQGSWPEEFYVVHGRRKPTFFDKGLRQHIRATESTCGAKSIYKLGAGGVGRGSIVGQPFLADMRKRGFSIWPFHPTEKAVVIEIYPACYWREMRRRTPEERAASLGSEIFSWIPSNIKGRAIDSRDAFDALISLAAMRMNREELGKLEQDPDSKTRIEGKIWQPSQSTPKSSS